MEPFADIIESSETAAERHGVPKRATHRLCDSGADRDRRPGRGTHDIGARRRVEFIALMVFRREKHSQKAYLASPRALDESGLYAREKALWADAGDVCSPAWKRSRSLAREALGNRRDRGPRRLSAGRGAECLDRLRVAAHARAKRGRTCVSRVDLRRLRTMCRLRTTGVLLRQKIHREWRCGRGKKRGTDGG